MDWWEDAGARTRPPATRRPRRSIADSVIGTDVTFTLAQEAEYTVLVFGHCHWREAVEFAAPCSLNWAPFLLSFRDLVEHGKGRPAPDDVKIDTWN